MSIAPFGSWQSPITTDLIVAETTPLGGVRFAGEDIVWQEARPNEGGRITIIRQSADGTIDELLPAPFSARTRVHEYGGGAWLVHERTVYFSNFADQQLYRLGAGESPVRITDTEGLRFANGVIDARFNRLICIVEDHTQSAAEPENFLGAVDLDTGAVSKLADGHDFFAAPCLNPAGTRLAWITWDHPNMPWDTTTLWLADLDETGSLHNVTQVTDGVEESVQQPRFSPAGVLHFISDRSGWWNIYRCDTFITNLWEKAAEFGQPHWGFGLCTYAFDQHGDVICVFDEAGDSNLARIPAAGGAPEVIDTPFTAIGGVSLRNHSCIFTAASPTSFSGIVLFDLQMREHQLLRQSCSLELDPGYYSVPEPVSFASAGGDTAHAFYYPPANKDFEAPTGELPPLLVILHGGPTSATHATLSLSLQFWTSRGFAILDVNYRGSTGYGRSYRQKLNGNWGVTDVEDTVYGARHLVSRGLADESRLAIRGGSAGGYTTLAALTFENTFSAGASHYGIGDLEALAKDTHKFESRYLDSMIGRYPEDIAVYRARSPIHHTDQLSCPVIFFQGLEDKVVPPNQAEAMVAALDAKGIPVAYVPFEGEQHGFRRAENIKRALDLELYFYARVFGFTTADQIEPIPIKNLPDIT